MLQDNHMCLWFQLPDHSLVLHQLGAGIRAVHSLTKFPTQTALSKPTPAIGPKQKAPIIANGSVIPGQMRVWNIPWHHYSIWSTSLRCHLFWMCVYPFLILRVLPVLLDVTAFPERIQTFTMSLEVQVLFYFIQILSHYGEGFQKYYSPELQYVQSGEESEPFPISHLWLITVSFFWRLQLSLTLMNLHLSPQNF